jgi:ribosomal protein L3
LPRTTSIEVIGTSKGRGFAGFVKRHGFAAARDSRLDVPPRTGSIGASAYPSRVIKAREWRAIWASNARRQESACRSSQC